jgi:membrane protease YdiL (CAAX protease family)
MKRFASEHPVAFSVMATFLVLALYIVAGIIAAITTTNLIGHQAAEASGRFAASALIVCMLWRLGWIGDVGLTRLGKRSVWLMVFLVTAYLVVVTMFAFFGDLGFGLPDPAWASVVALNGSAAAVLEEIVFRGLILYALVRTWGNSASGLPRIVLLSSFLFGASHLIRLLLGQPIPQVNLLAIDAFISGVYYAAFVLYSGSIWPPIAIHVALNAIVGARAVGVEGFEEPVSGWLVILVFELPALLLGLLLLRRTRTLTTHAWS